MLYVVDHDNRELIGHIIKKSWRGFVIQIDDNRKTIIESTIPQYNEVIHDAAVRQVGGWDFEQNQTSNGMTFSILEYAPMRLFISKKINKSKILCIKLYTKCLI